MPDDAVESFELSPQQGRLWTAEPSGPSARTQAVLEIDGDLAPSAVADALAQSVARHEILRTTFVRQAGLTIPLQAVHALLEPHFTTIEVPSTAAQAQAEQLATVCRAELEATLDLERGPLVRGAFVTLGEGHSRLVLTVSALCADATSTALLLAEVAGRLASVESAEEPLQYADFAAWQNELSDSDEDEARAARAFWSELGDLHSPTLPFTGTDASAAREEITIAIDDALAQALAGEAGRYGAAPAALVQAAWHVVLGRLAGEETTAIGFLAAERRHPDLDGAVGAFARAVPIQARVDGARSFAEVLAEVVRARGDALVRQDYAPLGGAPGVEAAFVEYPAALAQPGDVRLRIGAMACTGPQLALVLACGTNGDALTATLTYDPARHAHSSATRIADGLLRLLRAVAEDAGVALGDVELLGDEDRRRLLDELNDTGAEIPQACAHELIARWAASDPERTAILDAEGAITYSELDARANQLAHRLQRCGVGADVGVGLCTDRSIEMVIGLLGILKAGGAYVPLHYEHPQARLRHQLETAGARALVTQSGLLARLPDFDGEIVCLDSDLPELAGESTSAPASAATHESLAYVIYTSGSTGAPKGVAVTHGNLVNYAADIARRVGADEEPRSFGLVTSISTDLGNTSVFGALCSGGVLVLVPPDAAGDPTALSRLTEGTPLDVLKITPSHLATLLVAGDGQVLPRRWLVLGGERADWDLIARVRALSKCSILNHYGPTETTVGSCTFVVGDGVGEYAPASVPIGRPISNTSCYVTDERGQLAPVGVAGRLFIAGAGVARGYVGEAELTAQRFLPDPFARSGSAGAPARMYDTGDLARWLPDGTLEFLGREDEQVKIRGYRVEPAEVEAALRSHPGVKEAVAVARPSATGAVALVAYCTVGDTALDQDELRAHLASWLPDYMLPSAIVVVEELPRTPSGKIDRLQLPDPEVIGSQASAYVAPRTPLEETVAAIWAHVLGVSQVGVEDDFFALGGHSLLATQVVAQVRSDFAVDLPLHSLFTYPTVASLSGEIVAMMGDSDEDETARLMAELEGMSDEEAQRLLAADLPPDAGRQ